MAKTVRFDDIVFFITRGLVGGDFLSPYQEGRMLDGVVGSIEVPVREWIRWSQIETYFG